MNCGKILLLQLLLKEDYGVMLTIYNTFTRKKEEFKPLHPGVVNIPNPIPKVHLIISIAKETFFYTIFVRLWSHGLQLHPYRQRAQCYCF